MQITKDELQKSLNQYLSTPGLLFVAGQGAMGFANQLVADLGLDAPEAKPDLKVISKTP